MAGMSLLVSPWGTNAPQIALRSTALSLSAKIQSLETEAKGPLVLVPRKEPIQLFETYLSNVVQSCRPHQDSSIGEFKHGPEAVPRHNLF